MTTSKQSQPAARRRGELHRANGDRQVAQVVQTIRRRHLNLNTLPLRANPGSVWRARSSHGARPRTRTAHPRALAHFHAPRERAA